MQFGDLGWIVTFIKPVKLKLTFKWHIWGMGEREDPKGQFSVESIVVAVVDGVSTVAD